MSERVGGRVGLIIRWLLASLALFWLARLALLLAYPQVFGGLSGMQIGAAFWQGLRFDLAAIAMFAAAPVLLALLPFRFADSRPWQGLVGLLWYLLLFGAAALLIADLLYFGYVQRHIGREFWQLGNDLAFLLDIATTEYLSISMALTAIGALLLVPWMRQLPWLLMSSGFGWRWLRFVLAFPVLLLAIRGGQISGKPMHLIDAFDVGDERQAQLVLNGVYSALRSYSASGAAQYPFSAGQLQQALAEHEPQLAGRERPFVRQVVSDGPSGVNLVFVLLESWSFEYIDALAGKGYGVTPNFDRLIGEGLAFERFYANGQRSIHGIQAALSGVPVLPGLEELGRGLEASNFSRLGRIAGEAGYQTLFVQSSPRRSFRMDAIARSLGFTHYLGAEDTEPLLDYPAAAPPFGWDYETYMTARRRLDALGEPFVGVIYTGTTHPPFAPLPARFLKHPPGQGDNDFLNALYYADWSLGQFMQAARQSDWFDNTVFVFTADHAYKHGGSFVEGFHTPLLIYAPGRIAAARDSRVGSQLNLLPTFVQLLGLEGPLAAFGGSLLDEHEAFALVSAGGTLGAITDRAWLSHSLRSRLGAGGIDHAQPDEAELAALQQRLLLRAQLAYESLLNNRWAAP